MSDNLENVPAKILLPGKISSEDSTTLKFSSEDSIWKIFQRRFYYLEFFSVESSLEFFL